MAEQIKINVTRSSDQKSITITDITDWSGSSIDSLTGIELQFYSGDDVETPINTYSFTSSEDDEYTANGFITITFLNSIGSEYITDGWYEILMSATNNTYLSNYDGFGAFAKVKNTVYEKINDLRTPEENKIDMEKFHFQYMLLNGLDWLDLSTSASRQIKFEKRLESIQQLNS